MNGKKILAGTFSLPASLLVPSFVRHNLLSMSNLLPFLLCLVPHFLLSSCAQQGKTMPTSNPPSQHSVKVEGATVHFLQAGSQDAPTVLLLHGGRFTKDTWEQLGTPMVLAKAGFRALALDLPGYGASEKSALPREKFLDAFLSAMSLEKVALVSPSMSGSYSLPFVARYQESLWAFVPVAPAGIQRYSKELQGSPVPCLVLWGEKDRVFPVSDTEALAKLFASSQVRIFPGASHPCYLDRPEAFHKALVAFLQKQNRKD